MTESIFTKLERPFVVLDSEWHVGKVIKARLVSLAVTRYEPRAESSVYSWVFNPEQPIDPSTTNIHGFKDEDVADQPIFAERAADVLDALKGADIGGYSVAGDIQIIQAEFQLAGLTWDIAGCAIVDPFQLWNARERRRLEDAYARFVGTSEKYKAHDAGDDVAMTAAVIDAMADGRSVQELHDEVYSDMVDIAGKFRRNETGEIIFAFGPHKGDLARFNPGFLSWMQSRDFPPSTLQAIDLIYKEMDERRTGRAMPSWENDEIPF